MKPGTFSPTNLAVRRSPPPPPPPATLTMVAVPAPYAQSSYGGYQPPLMMRSSTPQLSHYGLPPPTHHYSGMAAPSLYSDDLLDSTRTAISRLRNTLDSYQHQDRSRYSDSFNVTRIPQPQFSGGMTDRSFTFSDIPDNSSRLLDASSVMLPSTPSRSVPLANTAPTERVETPRLVDKSPPKVLAAEIVSKSEWTPVSPGRELDDSYVLWG